MHGNKQRPEPGTTPGSGLSVWLFLIGVVVCRWLVVVEQGSRQLFYSFVRHADVFGQKLAGLVGIPRQGCVEDGLVFGVKVARQAQRSRRCVASSHSTITTCRSRMCMPSRPKSRVMTWWSKKWLRSLPTTGMLTQPTARCNESGARGPCAARVSLIHLDVMHE